MDVDVGSLLLRLSGNEGMGRCNDGRRCQRSSEEGCCRVEFHGGIMVASSGVLYRSMRGVESVEPLALQYLAAAAVGLLSTTTA